MAGAAKAELLPAWAPDPWHKLLAWEGVGPQSWGAGAVLWGGGSPSASWVGNHQLTLSFQHHWGFLTPLAAAPGHRSTLLQDSCWKPKGLDLPLLLIPVPEGRVRFGQTTAQPSLAGSAGASGTCRGTCRVVGGSSHCVWDSCGCAACSWTGSGLLSHALHWTLTSKAVPGSGGLCQAQVGCARAGGQLQPSGCIFPGSQGLGSSVPAHRAQVKPLWLPRLGSSCCQSRWGAERGESSGAAAC